MKTLKIGVILLALLLAAMAMVPMASAAENNEVQTAIDLNTIQIPELQFNESQDKVIIKNELSLDPDYRPLQKYTSKKTLELSDSKIPYGSIIYHSDDGVTTVFDSKGKQLFAAEDAKTTMVTGSPKEIPVTFVHEVPSGSMILVDPKNRDITYTFDNNNQLILTVIDNSKSDEFEPDVQNTVSCTSTGLCKGWLEYAEDNYIPELNRFQATWITPSRPLSSDMGEKIAIFNGIQPSGNSLIIQPVLEWNVNSNNYAWTAAPWYYRSNSDKYYGRRITGIQPGDTICGEMVYSVLNGYPGWWVSITRNNDPVSSIFIDELSTTSGLNAEVVLEATGIGINNDNDLPGYMSFSNMIYRKADGSAASVSLSGYVDPTAASHFSGLSAIIEQNPGHVRLWTPN